MPAATRKKTRRLTAAQRDAIEAQQTEKIPESWFAPNVNALELRERGTPGPQPRFRIRSGRETTTKPHCSRARRMRDR